MSNASRALSRSRHIRHTAASAGRLLPFLLVSYLVAFLDRNNIGFAKLEFTRDLGMTEAAYGLAAGIFYIGYILFEIPSNLLLARIGARKTMARILMLWGLARWARRSSRRRSSSTRCASARRRPRPDLSRRAALSHLLDAGSQRARFTSLFMLAIPVSG